MKWLLDAPIGAKSLPWRVVPALPLLVASGLVCLAVTLPVIPLLVLARSGRSLLAKR